MAFREKRTRTSVAGEARKWWCYDTGGGGEAKRCAYPGRQQACIGKVLGRYLGHWRWCRTRPHLFGSFPFRQPTGQSTCHASGALVQLCWQWKFTTWSSHLVLLVFGREQHTRLGGAVLSCLDRHGTARRGSGRVVGTRLCVDDPTHWLLTSYIPS
ncbi:hypothetical protein BC567DRAFT_232152 [Phyllosticta citribraziliensis]